MYMHVYTIDKGSQQKMETIGKVKQPRHDSRTEKNKYLK